MIEDRRQCQFQLIRYVPDPVKNEFVNIGVVLRAEEQSVFRLTRDWSRVRCLDPDVDTHMLEALESEVELKLRTSPGEPVMHPSILSRFEDTLSNGLQITESKGYLAETVLAGLEDLMSRYVDNPPREKSVRRRVGRGAVLAAMRPRFEKAGVWALMQKNISAAKYTKAGDPLRIDCGYQNGMVKMFQAISLETDPADAKLLAYSAAGLREGVEEKKKANLLLTAIIEPISWPEGDNEPPNESKERYDYARELMESHEIRVLTTLGLENLADEARKDLRV